VSDVQALLDEQAGYYRERAGEYDDWWFRRDRYDHGPELNARWFADVAQLETVLEQFDPAVDVLEMACGTGLWTQRLIDHADRVTVVDGSAEMLDLCRARVNDPRVEYVEADLFDWEPAQTYDVCFFSFWLSHVPEERFEAFWEKVGRALAPAGRVFFIDSLRSDKASATDHALPEPDDPTMLRRLADGREYRIVKRFYEPASLQERLARLGWAIDVGATSTFFLYGQGHRAGDTRS
jgi:demethylmenaquinone methyltransferase/2-methoxy-6-polyprenyl-1,4-benzoquinol methylase